MGSTHLCLQGAAARQELHREPHTAPQMQQRSLGRHHLGGEWWATLCEQYDLSVREAEAVESRAQVIVQCSS